MARVIIDQILAAPGVAAITRCRTIIDVLARADAIVSNHLLETRFAHALVVICVDSSGGIQVLAGPVATALNVEWPAIVDVGARLLPSEAAISCTSERVGRRSIRQPVRRVPSFALHCDIIREGQSAAGRSTTGGVRRHSRNPAGDRIALATRAELATGQALPLEAGRVSGSSRQRVPGFALVRHSALVRYTGSGVVWRSVERWGRWGQPASDRLAILIFGS
mmetsp:Transcript_26018/g.57485  ORF Transcript_26018/g.57485 Transcript_26018/m.57485 type:complete len:222 (-) Transcript_26018:278-943(-)